jgi:hypothetical protein
VIAGVVAFATACSGASRTAAPAGGRARPCEGRGGFRDQNLLVTWFVTFTFTPRDQLATHNAIPELLLARMNEKAGYDNVGFVVADGVDPNVTIAVTVHSDAQDHLSARARIVLWDGTVLPASSGDAPFVDPFKMVRSLADDIYRWFHDGWDCPKQ